MSWIVARQDRAWYATGLAKQRLLELGQTEGQIYQLDGDWGEFTPKDRALFQVARQLSATSVVLTDDEVEAAVTLAGPRDVVQVISYTTNRASFDRITEAAGLSLSESAERDDALSSIGVRNFPTLALAPSLLGEELG